MKRLASRRDALQTAWGMIMIRQAVPDGVGVLIERGTTLITRIGTNLLKCWCKFVQFVSRLDRFGFVKTSVIHGQPAAPVRSVNFNEPVTELNVAEGVILLGLNFSRDDRIDPDH